jgi:hypothetical protein
MSQRKFKRSQQKVKKVAKETPATPARQPSLQAMVWYKEEDWQTLKEMFVDGDMLPKTYEDWLERAEEMRVKVQAQGDAVIKVYIDPQTFPKWCDEKGMEMNAEARSQLAIEVAQAQSFSL